MVKRTNTDGTVTVASSLRAMATFDAMKEGKDIPYPKLSSKLSLGEWYHILHYYYKWGILSSLRYAYWLSK